MQAAVASRSLATKRKDFVRGARHSLSFEKARAYAVHATRTKVNRKDVMDLSETSTPYWLLRTPHTVHECFRKPSLSRRARYFLRVLILIPDAYASQPSLAPPCNYGSVAMSQKGHKGHVALIFVGNENERIYVIGVTKVKGRLPFLPLMKNYK